MSENLARGRVLDAGEAGLERSDLPPIGRTPADSRFDPRLWWPAERRALPIELEVGSGKGTFLVQQAAARLDVNYLGVEYARAYWLYAADRARRHGLDNVRLIHTDAAELINWYMPNELFRVVHVYFPDPWPKKRHHKRRFVQASMLRELHRVLVAGGEVRIVTDHADYFTWIEEHAAAVAELFERRPFERPAGIDGTEVVGTNFERKYRREGRPFHAMTLVAV